MAGRHYALTLILAAVFWALAPTLPLGVAQGQNQPPALDSDQPININADDLEVLQDQSLAIFSGNVVAVQGRIELRAEQLQVWYRPASDSGSNKAGSANSTIIRIDAIDKVQVSSATETANGDMGVYDVAEQRLTLTGAVVLTRGQDVLRGSKLVMNLATGQSLISGGRVHGRFVPPKRKNGSTK